MKTLLPALISGAILAITPLISRAAEGGESKPAAQEAATKSYRNVDVAAFDKLRGGTNTVVLDVRTPEEFAAGHIPGAINVDVNSPAFASQVSKLDTNKTYLVSCAMGGRSVKACNKMAPLQFGKLYNLEGGYSAWEAAGKPVEKK